MKTMILQLGVLILLTAVCGVAYNASNSGSPENYLPWTGGGKIYSHYATSVTTPDQAPAPASAASPEPRPAPVAPGAAPAASAALSPATPPVPAQAKPPSEFPMIHLAQAVEELDAGSIFIDARRTREYEQGHIPGAISICPYEQATFDGKIANLREADGVVLEAPVVVYCTNSNECESSKMVSAQLKIAGFTNILIYEGGFPEWQKEKADKIAKGSEPGKWNP